MRPMLESMRFTTITLATDAAAPQYTSDHSLVVVHAVLTNIWSAVENGLI